jgi:hypothetical protein
MLIKVKARMATTQDLPGVRTATSYGYSNNLGAEEPVVNSWGARSEERGEQFHGCLEIIFGAERVTTIAAGAFGQDSPAVPSWLRFDV